MHIRVSIASSVLTVAISTALVNAQSSPRFEVASVTPNTSGGVELGWVVENGRFTFTNVTAKMLVASAYGRPQQPLPDFQIFGGPKWLDIDRFDVAAKAESDPSHGSSELSETGMAMLRGLLDERFHLKAHREQREFAVYAMTRAKADRSLGPRMVRRTVDCADIAAGRAQGERCGGTIRPGALAAQGLTPAQIVSGLARFMPGIERPVIDRTGLSGSFDIALSWTPDTQQGDGPSFFTALEEQLGLKLQATRAPVDVVVIDSMSRPSAD